MEPNHGRDFHPRDLHIREGLQAPVTPTLLELANNPEKLISDLFSDSWRCWIAFPCGDGRWASIITSTIDAYNAGGTDIASTLGTVSTMVSFIREKNSAAMEFIVNQVEFAHQHHGVTGIQIVTHPLCGATKEEVCSRVKFANKVYKSPTKADTQLYLETKKVELEIHRRDLDIFRDWAFETFPFVVAVEYLRGTKWRLEPFTHHELAICRAIEVLRERGEWQET